MVYIGTGGRKMKLNNIYKKIAMGAAVVGMCLSTTLAFAEDQPHLLADGELFTVARVVDSSKVLYENKSNSTWVWHSSDGYPLGLTFSAFINGKKLPETVVKATKTVKGVPTKTEMIQAGKDRYGVKGYENRLIIYGTTGASAAKTDIAIHKIELFGRLLNVTVALTDAEKNTPLTMNLIYPETMQAIDLKCLPKAGNLRVRFVDMKGNALQTEDVLLGSL
jgi:hypothetical protein